MDWGSVHGEKARRIESPAPRLLETCWRVRTRQRPHRDLGIYADNAPGLEVRAGFSEEDLLKSQRTAEIGSARKIAGMEASAAGIPL